MDEVFLILLSPLLGFAIWIWGNHFLKKHIDLFSCIAIGVSFGLALLVSCQVFQQNPVHWTVEWFRLSEKIIFYVGFYVDNLTVLMLLTITLVAFGVHLFSGWYMQGDAQYPAYFGYLGLFSFAMIGLVLADNLLQMYIFWELVGLSSYLLIGFWKERPSANRAAKKAFLLNRIGDVGFLVGILLIYRNFHTLDIRQLQELLSSNSFAISLVEYHLIGFALFCGVIAKSAQFPLQLWLPDAMEGPTPVSALIHAATMVAAGVYLLARCFFLWSADVLLCIALIGALTSFWGAFSALTQQDIKKIWAYSTISQLGYMVMGIGAMAYEASALHLFTHAFFKAGLFLSAGVLIHTFHTQNLQELSGVGRKMPFEFVCFTVFAFALCGVPFFSGFLSKDAILLYTLAWAFQTAQSGSYVVFLIPMIGFLTAFLTAVYVSKVWIVLYFGENIQSFDSSYKTSISVKIPLFILALMSGWFAFSWNPLSAEKSIIWSGLAQTNSLPFLGAYFEQTKQITHSIHWIVSGLALICIFLGFGLSWRAFQKSEFSSDTLFFSKQLFKLSFHSFYWDKGYNQKIVPVFLQFSRVNKYFDTTIVDGVVRFLGIFQVVMAWIVAWFDRAIVDGIVKMIAHIAQWVGKMTTAPQNGNLQNYMVATLLFILGIIGWYWLFW